jgi:hypothetical protein
MTETLYGSPPRTGRRVRNPHGPGSVSKAKCSRVEDFPIAWDWDTIISCTVIIWAVVISQIHGTLVEEYIESIHEDTISPS